MQLSFINEFQLPKSSSKEINQLLQKCFPDTNYQERDYYKQLPHYRLLATKEGSIIGQVGIDFRVMNLNGQAINVFGAIDLCVDPTAQGHGVGKALMQELERIAVEQAHKVDFLFLVTETPAYYEALGYHTTQLTTSWLKIHQHNNYNVGTEHITDAYFLVKPVSDKKWADGELDLLGYMY